MSTVIPIVAFCTPILALFVIVPWVVRRQRAKLAAFRPTLAARGPMTLDEIAAATGTNAIIQGYLMEALDAEAEAGALERIPPPPGHPIARFYRDTRYGVPQR
jgi:hypothetical protein